MQQVMKQPSETREPALNTYKFSGFALLPENFLYCLVASDNIEAREEGIRKILALRRPAEEQKKRGKGRPRIVKRVLQPSKVEGINPNSAKWWNLIDIDAPGVEECPLTVDVTSEALHECLMSGTPLNIPKDMPGHSQSVERAVKLVSEASQHVYGLDSRHNFINAVILARKARKPFETKASYSETFADCLKFELH